MKLMLLSMFGVLVAMSVASSNADNPLLNELAKLRAATEEQTRFLNGLLGEERGGAAPVAGAAESQSPKVAPAKGLNSTGLKPASLQPASGLQSGASGGIPEEEWRRIFPKKLGSDRR